MSMSGPIKLVGDRPAAPRVAAVWARIRPLDHGQHAIMTEADGRTNQSS